jgi:hypothetical protein
VSTVGLTSITVAYNLRDIDASSDNTSMALALQYRVGSSGDYTNVPAGFVADASQGGTATLVTPVSAQLPATADNQPLVDVRSDDRRAYRRDDRRRRHPIREQRATRPGRRSDGPANGATGVAIRPPPR